MDFVTLEQAERLIGIPADTLRKRCQRGFYPFAIKKSAREGGIRPVWMIPPSEVCNLISAEESSQYKAIEEGFLKSLKDRFLTEKYIESTKYYLGLYWAKCGQSRSIEGLSAQNLERVYSHYTPDPQLMRDYRSTKDNYFKMLLAFTNYLIKLNLKTEDDLKAIKKLKPHKIYNLKRGVVDQDQIAQYLTKNKEWTSRTERSIACFALLIGLYAYAGLRKSEALQIELKRVDLAQGYFVTYGKGRKERYVLIFPELAKLITDWLPYIEPGAKYLIHNEYGHPYTEAALNLKIARFKKETGLEFRPHDLRRAFATIAANYGMPITLIQEQLGHTLARTTEGYIRTTPEHLIKWGQKYKGLFGSPESKKADPVKDRLVMYTY